MELLPRDRDLARRSFLLCFSFFLCDLDSFFEEIRDRDVDLDLTLLGGDLDPRRWYALSKASVDRELNLSFDRDRGVSRETDLDGEGEAARSLD